MKILYFIIVFVLNNIFAIYVNHVYSATGKVHFVSNINQFDVAVKSAKPNDTIRMSPGRWENVKLVLKCNGEPTKPIVLDAEKVGKTIICGISSLQLSGKYLVVSGLFFTEGYSPKKNVIEFKDDNETPAHYSTIRHCVMINFNNPDRKIRKQWIDLYGTYNTIEYCYFEGKTDLGTMLSVEPLEENHQPEHHRLHHNYFAHRPPYKANGGEILRIARGETQKLSTFVIVEDNYFEYCDGENEIISVKSSDNIVRRNYFFECAGGVSLRCGARNDVYDNYFIANNKELSCGVKIHDAGHKIFNNLFYKVAGNTEYSASIALIAAHINPEILQNFKVSDVYVSNNTFVDCALPFNLGCIQETLKLFELPENVKISNNLVYSTHSNSWQIIHSGGKNIELEKNLIILKDSTIFDGKKIPNTEIKTIKKKDFSFPVTEKFSVKLPSYIKTDITGNKRNKNWIGALENLNFSFENLPSASNCGPYWYKK